MKPLTQPTIYLLNGDFRKLIYRLLPASIDLVVTDPPYGRSWDSQWGPLAQECVRVLKPQGVFASYLGHYGLPGVLSRLSQHLDYLWLANIVFSKSNYRDELGLFTMNRPLGIYYKPPRPRPISQFVDTFISPHKEKQHHPWQQPVEEARSLIRSFCAPGGWVLDPCAGSGTTLLAAYESGRNAVGFELDPRTYETARKRLESAGIAVRA